MKKYKNTIYYISLLLTVVYLVYRLFFTLPNKLDISFVFACIVLLVEIVDAFFYFVFTINILTVKNTNIKAPKILKKDYPELDIFIATINEDIDLLEKTIISVKKMKYPDKNKIHIYVCDDGNRIELKKICNDYKIGYITRKSNVDAKAGNYNNALKKTKSPYIVVFDADMKPTPDFLLKAVPYLFYDKNVGFVQLPQSFDNPDIFQKRFKLLRYIPLEQTYFYHRIQIARNQNNSVIFCGTNAILSRKALNDIGGFATKTITEDFATGLLLERYGYKGIALPYNEAYGLNVDTVSSLIKQRSRWCRGCIQTYKNYKIIYKSGLNMKQKLDYLSGIYYWFFGIRNLLYLLIPLLYSFFNIKIVQGSFFLFIILFLLQYIIKRFFIDLLEDRKVSSTWNRIYEVILTPVIFLNALLESIGIHKKKFEVTDKKNNNRKTYSYYYLLSVHLLLFILNVIGVYISINKGLMLGLLEYIIPIFWLGTNSIYLLFALIFDISNHELFDDYSDTKSGHYSLLSIFVLLYHFIIYEIKIKRIVALFSIVLLFIFGNFIYHYYELQKSIIISDKALVTYNGSLSIENGKVVNQYKEIIDLNGVSSHNLNWYGRLYTKDNIKEVVDTWGINVFRLAVYTNPLEEGYIKNPEQITEIMKIIDYCIELDIYVIVDWHILFDNNPQTYKNEAIQFFEIISNKYKDSPNVIYEICNEPNGEDVTWDNDIKPYAEEVISVIRNNSSKSLIIVGLADWCRDISSAKSNRLEDPLVLYAVHFYAGSDYDETLKGEIQNALEEKMPIIITECGATNASGDGKLYKKEFNQWIDFLNENHIGWIIWQLSEKSETSSLVIKKEVQDRLDYLYKRYTEKELERKKYHINDYLSDTGKYIKEIFTQVNKND